MHIGYCIIKHLIECLIEDPGKKVATETQFRNLCQHLGYSGRKIGIIDTVPKSKERDGLYYDQQRAVVLPCSPNQCRIVGAVIIKGPID